MDVLECQGLHVRGRTVDTDHERPGFGYLLLAPAFVLRRAHHRKTPPALIINGSNLNCLHA
jgi:hypothetical protein